MRPRESKRPDGSVTTSYTFRYRDVLGRKRRVTRANYEPPAQLLICSYLLHHDPAVFPAPNEFRPERFLDGRSEASWLPWGGGRKHCPGRRLALLEMETVLATAVAVVSIHPAAAIPERPRWRSVIVAPHGGSRVVLRNRPA